MWGEHELGLRLPGEGSCFQQPSRGGPSPARPGVQLQLGMGWRRLGRETEPHSWGLPVLWCGQWDRADDFGFHPELVGLELTGLLRLNHLT